MRLTDKISSQRFILLCIVFLSFFSGALGYEDLAITVEYSGVSAGNQTITVDYNDEWLLRPDDEYCHPLMQASFVLVAAGFRDKERDLSQKDFNILDLFTQAGYTDAYTWDFDVVPSIDTIGTAIAHKKVGDAAVIAVSVSGNNYQGEWAGNMLIDDDYRVTGFNQAADRVMERLDHYILDQNLSGDLRLWTAGFSRSAAVVNDFAADATDSGRFQAVYAYTFATPRTTKDIEPDRYRNIFNLINPFDVVPMIPFPEWGFHRYGIDLFIPSVETDSDWFGLIDNISMSDDQASGGSIVINPQMNITLHTLFDYLTFFINSANTYKENYQNPLVELMETRDIKVFLHDISQEINFGAIRRRLVRLDQNARYQMHEFYNFLDYVTQQIYLTFAAEKHFAPVDFYWDPELSVQENIAFNHYDKTYRAWLFSDDDPKRIFRRDAEYAHIVIHGDVDVDVFDENGDFIVHIDGWEGTLSVLKEDARMSDFQGKESDILVFADRIGPQTRVVLPLDQRFALGIYSNIDQTIRLSYVEYSADRLQADVRYIYYDEYAEGEYFLEEFDPEIERKITREELLEMGVLAVEPWSSSIVYSPTAVMRLENSGIFHPSPVFLIAFVVLILLLFITLFIFMIAGIFKIILNIIRRRKAASIS